MVDDKKIKIGVTGCGTISGTHAEAIAESKYGMLTAAHSRTKSNLKSFCDSFGTQGFTDYKEFLAEADIDAVVVCTPSGTHLDYAEQAAKAKKHVIVEKPIEVSMSRGKALIDTCESNGVKLAVIYQNRFIDNVIRMKKMLASGKLGKILMVDASVKWFRSQEYYSSAQWRGTMSLDGGGAVINQAVHTVDLMLWLCGDVESLYAYTSTLTHQDIEGEDNAVATFQFKNGAMGVFKASTSIVPPQERKIEVHAEKGTAVLEGDALDVLKKGSDKPAQQNGSGAGASSPLAGMNDNYHKNQYDQILTAIKNDNQPVVSGEESLKSLAFVKAMYASAKQQRAIYLEDFYKSTMGEVAKET